MNYVKSEQNPDMVLFSSFTFPLAGYRHTVTSKHKAHWIIWITLGIQATGQENIFPTVGLMKAKKQKKVISKEEVTFAVGSMSKQSSMNNANACISIINWLNCQVRLKRNVAMNTAMSVSLWKEGKKFYFT